LMSMAIKALLQSFCVWGVDQPVTGLVNLCKANRYRAARAA
jgi:hypothetical protein